MENTKGKFITIYGINGIGKTTQLDLLINYLKKYKKVSYLKYPIYDLEPEGPFINKYLREPGFSEKNKLTTEELQEKYAQNRRRYENKLKERIKNGEWIIAEDYTGTGIVWGLVWGADLEYLEKINKDLLKPDLNILLHGNRFETAIEVTHRNEKNCDKIKLAKNFHLLLAHKYNWEIINANQEKEKVHEDLKNKLKKHL